MGETVNHPEHYNAGNIEVIDTIEDWKLGFHLGNAVKYIARAAHKGKELEDLRKARWYLDRYITQAEKTRLIVTNAEAFWTPPQPHIRPPTRTPASRPMPEQQQTTEKPMSTPERPEPRWRVLATFDRGFGWVSPPMWFLQFHNSDVWREPFSPYEAFVMELKVIEHPRNDPEAVAIIERAQQEGRGQVAAH